MTHDAYCPVPEMEAVAPLHPEDAGINCECPLIAAVREDERGACIKEIRQRRDEFAQQVSARPVQTKALSNAIYEDAISTLRGPAVAAARGEKS